MSRMASAISWSRRTSATPPVAPVRTGNAHPAPTKSSPIGSHPPSVDLHEGALDGDHGPRLELRRRVCVDADRCALDRHGRRTLGVELHALEIDGTATTVDLHPGVGLHGDLAGLEVQVPGGGDLVVARCALGLDLDGPIGVDRELRVGLGYLEDVLVVSGLEEDAVAAAGLLREREPVAGAGDEVPAIDLPGRLVDDRHRSVRGLVHSVVEPAEEVRAAEVPLLEGHEHLVAD